MCPEAAWTRARDDYVATGLTKKAISDKHQLPYSTLIARAKRESWDDLRQARIQHDRDTRAKQADAELGIGSDDKIAERKRWLARARRLGEALDAVIEELIAGDGAYKNPDQLCKLTHAAARTQEIAFKAMNIVNDGADSSQGYKPPVIEIAGASTEKGDFPERYTESGDASDD